jgi:hypothetical protein
MTQPTTNPNVVLSANVDNYQTGMASAEGSTNKVLDALSRLNTATDQLFKSAGRKLEIVSASTMVGIGAAVESLARLDKQMSQVRATAVLAGGTSVPNLTRSLQVLSTVVPASTSDLAAMATTIQGLGVQGSQNIAKLTETFTKLQAVTGESGQSLASNMIRLTQSMGHDVDPQRMEAYASAVANLKANLGASAEAITSFAQAIQPMGKLIGLTETQILGLSGAFAKAGADSGPAYNAFNQLTTMLINDLQTGNPQIRQFSDLMGITSGRLREIAKSDPAAMYVKLFDALQNKGPASLRILQGFGLDGVRTINALQRVGQGGGIGAALGISERGAADPSKFNKAADSAFNNLNDQIKRLGNSVKELVTGPFGLLLVGLTKIVTAAADVASTFAKIANMPIVHQFLQVAGAMLGMVAPLVGLAGHVLVLLPLLAKLGIAWQAIFSRSGLSLVGGFRDRLRGVEDSAAQRAIAASAAGTGQRVGLIQRGFYGLGGAAGAGARAVGLGGVGGPGMTARAVEAGMVPVRWMGRELYRNPAGIFVSGAAAGLRGGMTGIADDAMRRPAGRFFGSPDFWARQRERGGQVMTSTGGFLGLSRTTTGPAPEARPMPGPIIRPSPVPTATSEAKVAAAAEKNAKAMGSSGEAAEKTAKNFQTVDKRAIPLASAFGGVTRAAVRDAEATTTAVKTKIRETEETAVATRSLGQLAMAATRTAVGLGAGAVGGAAKLGGSALLGVGRFAAANPIMTGLLVGMMAVPAVMGANKQKSEEDLNLEAGTAVGNLNRFNSAVGEATLTVHDFIGEMQKPSQPRAPSASAWSREEFRQARDAAFKAVGYDAASSQTTDEKLATLQTTMLDKISSQGGLSSEAQRNYRMQLEKLLPNREDAQRAYKGLSEMTGQFQRAPNDLGGVANLYGQLGQSYVENLARSANPVVLPWRSSGSQRAKALIETPLHALAVRSSGGGGAATRAEQEQASAQWLAQMIGASRGMGAFNAGAGGVGAALANRYGMTTPEGGVAGAGEGGRKSFYREVAQQLGLSADYGNVGSLQDFAKKLYSGDAAAKSVATRLFGPEGQTDLSNPVRALRQAQLRSDVAGSQVAAQVQGRQSRLFQDFGLAGVGVRPDTATARAAVAVLGGGQKPGDTAVAVQGIARALNVQSINAADAQQSIDKWANSLNSADPAVRELVTQVRAASDAMADMDRSTMSLPQQIASVALAMSKVDKSSIGGPEEWSKLNQQREQLVNSGIQQAQQYLQAIDQFRIQRRQGEEDYNKQVTRANEAFTLQQTRARENYDKQVARSEDDFHTQQVRSIRDFHTSMEQSQQDYNTSRRRANREFLYQEQQYVKSMAQSLDPWNQVQAQSLVDAQQALQNMGEQNQEFRTAGRQLRGLRRMGLSQNVIDVMGLSDPKNMQQLNRFYTDLAQNPELVRQFNRSMRNRLDWTKGLATDKSSTQWREMRRQFNVAANDAANDFERASKRAHEAFDRQQSRSERDFNKMLRRNAADFRTMTEQSAEDFGTQMGQMQEDYDTSVKRSLRAINHFATMAFGNANEILQRAYENSSGKMHQFFRNVLSAYTVMQQGVRQANQDALNAAGGPGGGGGGPGGGYGATIPGVGNKGAQRAISSALFGAGASSIGVAGIMGNLAQESGFDPTAGRGTAHQGIAQWGGSRWSALKSYAQKQGTSPYNLDTQIAFMIREAQQRGDIGATSHASSAAAAAAIWNTRFEGSGEGPGDPGYANRTAQARHWYHAYQRAAHRYQLSPAGRRGGSGHYPVGSGLTQGRTDQGVDWSGSGPVYAVGAGRITRMDPHNAGWLGSFTVLKLDNPPSHDRRFVFYAEGIRPIVHVGQHVRTGQKIGQATGGSVGIEIGWAHNAAGLTQARAHNQQAKGDDPGEFPTAYGINFAHYIKQHPAINRRAIAEGALVVNGEQTARIGERGPEAIIPLNERGAHFLVDMLRRLNADAWDSRTSGRYSSKVSPTINNTHIDSSTNFTGAGHRRGAGPEPDGERTAQQGADECAHPS